MNRSVEIVVLSEDIQHECFVRRFLNLLTRNYHRYRFRTAPRGKGSGEQWVREHFPTELKEHRRQRARLDCCLIMVVDADNQTIEERMRGYQEACASQGIEFRQSEDRVAFAVPARNIETWLAYLRGDPTDEIAAFPRLRGHERDCQPQADALYAMCQARQLRDPAPLSLQHACEEFARLRL